MFSIKKKLDKNLAISLKKDNFKLYRVIIHSKLFIDKIEVKIKNLRGEIIGSVPALNCVFAIISGKCIERLIEYPEIDYITFDDFAYICGNSSSSKSITVTTKYKYTGKGQCIGLIDSGVYPHPDLTSGIKRIVKFVDIINSFKYPYDDNGHGTIVSGIMCGDKGIAKNSTLYCIKAFNSLGKGYLSHILLGLNMLISESSELKIKVICLPFETTNQNSFIMSLFQNMFEIAAKKNIIIVVPSGSNENTKCSIRGISTLENCLTVGGLDTSSEPSIYKYSSCGPFGKLTKPDLCAPCVNINCLNSNTSYISERNGIKIYPRKLENLYTTFSGTSCAAAYISGICALLLESNTDLTCSDIISLIKSSCKLLKLAKWQQGEGALDINSLFNTD